MLRNAILERRLKPCTPLHADAWEYYLFDSGLITKYPLLPRSIRFGFYAGIRPISATFVPHNSSTIERHAAAFDSLVAHEFSIGRYIGPFCRLELEFLIGPFQSSPLSLIPKPHKPDKLRLIQNLSYPFEPRRGICSINSTIDSSAFPCTWGTFTVICLLLASLPPDSEGGCRDGTEAFRSIALDESQWPGAVVRLRGTDQFAMDTCDMFGAASAVGVYGLVADAGCDIMRSLGLGPISKWVDDHVFLRIRLSHLDDYNRRRKAVRARITSNGGCHHVGGRLWYTGGHLPDGRCEEFDEDYTFPLRNLSCSSPRSQHDSLFTYSFQDIDYISAKLGSVWNLEKDVQFGTSFPFTGFEWDIPNLSVALTEAKRQKYLAALDVWLSKRTHTLLEAQKLHGKLLHTTSILPIGRAYLTALEAFLAISSDNPHVPRSPPRSTRHELEWWRKRLSQPHLRRPIPVPVEVFDVGGFSDASSGVGLGVVLGGRWRSWRLLPDWKHDGRDIGWAEAVAFEFLVYYILQLPSLPGNNLKVFGDNRGVVEGWWRGRSRNIAVNGVFRRLLHRLEQSDLYIHPRYIASAGNPADNPSRGVFPPYSLLLPPISIPEQLRQLIVDFDAPITGSSPPTQWSSALRKNLRPTEYHSQSEFNRCFERSGAELLNDETFWWRESKSFQL